MTETMTDERALKLLRDAVADSRFEYDKTVRGYAIAHIAARLAQTAGVPSAECWRRAIEESFLVRQFRPSLYWIEQRANELAATPEAP